MSDFHRHDIDGGRTKFFADLESHAILVPLEETGLSIEKLGQLAERGLAYRGHYPNEFSGTGDVEPFFEIVPGSLAARFHELAEAGTVDAGDAGRFILELMSDSDDELRGHWPELF